MSENEVLSDYYNNSNLLRDIETLIGNMENKQAKQNESMLKNIESLLENVLSASRDRSSVDGSASDEISNYDLGYDRIKMKSPIIMHGKSNDTAATSNVQEHDFMEKDVRNFVSQHIQDIRPDLVVHVQQEIQKNDDIVLILPGKSGERENGNFVDRNDIEIESIHSDKRGDFVFEHEFDDENETHNMEDEMENMIDQSIEEFREQEVDEVKQIESIQMSQHVVDPDDQANISDSQFTEKHVVEDKPSISAINNKAAEKQFLVVEIPNGEDDFEVLSDNFVSETNETNILDVAQVNSETISDTIIEERILELVPPVSDTTAEGNIENFQNAQKIIPKQDQVINTIDTRSSNSLLKENNIHDTEAFTKPEPSNINLHIQSESSVRDLDDSKANQSSITQERQHTLPKTVYMKPKYVPQLAKKSKRTRKIYSLIRKIPIQPANEVLSTKIHIIQSKESADIMNNQVSDKINESIENHFESNNKINSSQTNEFEEPNKPVTLTSNAVDHYSIKKRVSKIPIRKSSIATSPKSEKSEFDFNQNTSVNSSNNTQSEIIGNGALQPEDTKLNIHETSNKQNHNSHNKSVDDQLENNEESSSDYEDVYDESVEEILLEQHHSVSDNVTIINQSESIMDETMQHRQSQNLTDLVIDTQKLIQQMRDEIKTDIASLVSEDNYIDNSDEWTDDDFNDDDFYGSDANEEEEEEEEGWTDMSSHYDQSEEIVSEQDSVHFVENDLKVDVNDSHKIESQVTPVVNNKAEEHETLSMVEETSVILSENMVEESTFVITEPIADEGIVPYANMTDDLQVDLLQNNIEKDKTNENTINESTIIAQPTNSKFDEIKTSSSLNTNDNEIIQNSNNLENNTISTNDDNLLEHPVDVDERIEKSLEVLVNNAIPNEIQENSLNHSASEFAEQNSNDIVSDENENESPKNEESNILSKEIVAQEHGNEIPPQNEPTNISLAEKSSTKSPSPSTIKPKERKLSLVMAPDKSNEKSATFTLTPTVTSQSKTGAIRKQPLRRKSITNTSQPPLSSKASNLKNVQSRYLQNIIKPDQTAKSTSTQKPTVKTQANKASSFIKSISNKLTSSSSKDKSLADSKTMNGSESSLPIAVQTEENEARSIRSSTMETPKPRRKYIETCFSDNYETSDDDEPVQMPIKEKRTFFQITKSIDAGEALLQNPQVGLFNLYQVAYLLLLYRSVLVAVWAIIGKLKVKKNSRYLLIEFE